MQRPRFTRSQRRGFSLLEIVVVLGLIGLLTAVVAGGSVALLRERPATGEEQMRLVLTKVRRQAVTNMQELRLSFDGKKRLFLVQSVEGDKPIPLEIKGEFQVEFVPPKAGSSIMIAGEGMETTKLPFITFYRDGSCSPFRAQLRTGGPSRIMTFDPWTCAEMIEESSR